MALTDKLTAIGDAIRTKTGGTELLTLDEMPQEIQSIQTGSGGDGDTALADSFIKGELTSYSSQSLDSVGDYGFYSKNNLQTIDCPNVVSVGRYGFAVCRNLNSVNIKWDLVTHISDYTFYMCSAISQPTMFPEVTTIGDYGFQESGFEELFFPKLTDASGYGVFYGSYSSSSNHLRKIVVGNQCVFGSSCFLNQTALEALILSANGISTLSASNAFNSSSIANGTGYIYVPKALIEDYKVATNWATYANQFRAIEDYPDVCGEVS